MDERTAIVLVTLALAFVLLTGDGDSTMNRSDFLSLVGNEVKRQLSELRPDLTDEEQTEAAAIVAAQAAHETGYGITIAWRQGWNFGNVTAGSTWRGPVVNGPDTENGKPITQAFRKYASISDAVSDFLTGVLNWQRERDAGAISALLTGDAPAYVTALHEAGYFTASETSYLAGVNAALPAARRVIA